MWLVCRLSGLISVDPCSLSRPNPGRLEALTQELSCLRPTRKCAPYWSKRRCSLLHLVSKVDIVSIHLRCATVTRSSLPRRICTSVTELYCRSISTKPWGTPSFSPWNLEDTRSRAYRLPTSDGTFSLVPTPLHTATVADLPLLLATVIDLLLHHKFQHYFPNHLQPVGGISVTSSRPIFDRQASGRIESILPVLTIIQPIFFWCLVCHHLRTLPDRGSQYTSGYIGFP
jgi:hypothetical protein